MHAGEFMRERETLLKTMRKVILVKLQERNNWHVS